MSPVHFVRYAPGLYHHLGDSTPPPFIPRSKGLTGSIPSQSPVDLKDPKSLLNPRHPDDRKADARLLQRGRRKEGSCACLSDHQIIRSPDFSLFSVSSSLRGEGVALPLRLNGLAHPSRSSQDPKDLQKPSQAIPIFSPLSNPPGPSGSLAAKVISISACRYF
jgi:hypothetical protein